MGCWNGAGVSEGRRGYGVYRGSMRSWQGVRREEVVDGQIDHTEQASAC